MGQAQAVGSERTRAGALHYQSRRPLGAPLQSDGCRVPPWPRTAGRRGLGSGLVWHAARVSDQQALRAAQAALLAEAASKSGLVWLRPADQSRAWPAWHVWHDGAVHTVSGPGEQQLPELSGPVVLLARSKDTGARLISVPTTARRLDPTGDAWLAAATALAASRLNSATAPADLPARWREAAVITRFTPDAAAVESPGSYGQASGAAPPAPSAGTTSDWRPWHWRGRRRR